MLVMIKLCGISPNIRKGLLEAFYGVYEKDPDKVGYFYLAAAFVPSSTRYFWFLFAIYLFDASDFCLG